MSKINAVRLINLNYNHNAIRVSDETFRLNGKSTLISLRNGGGKSVLVQMMMAPFVHRQYQNMKDRPFASYFTGNKPTFILVEWKLDGGAGFMLAGMMVRKSQEISQEHTDGLQMVNFIAEYGKACLQDIDHLPVVEKTKKSVVLKGFNECRQMFEGFKRERGIPFFYYDMQNPSQARQYYGKLSEYQVFYKEWETIIRKVNLKESGLSDLFADCKDEKGLVQKWFLEAVEKKLNKEKNRMKEFQGIVEKYTAQYKDNQSKIKRRDTIEAFREEAQGARQDALRCQAAEEEVALHKNRIADFIRQVKLLLSAQQQNALDVAKRIEDIAAELSYLEYEKLSREIYEIMEQESSSGSNLQMLGMERDDLANIRDAVQHKLSILLCAKLQEGVTECEKECLRGRQRLALCMEKEETLEPERKRLGTSLYLYYEQQSNVTREEQKSCGREISAMETERDTELSHLEGLRETERKLSGQSGALQEKIRSFDVVEERFNQEYGEGFRRNILGEYEPGALSIQCAEYEKRLQGLMQEKAKVKQEAERHREQGKALQRAIEDKAAAKIRLEAQKEEEKRLLLSYEEELDARRVMLQYFGLLPEDLFDGQKINAAITRKLSDTDLSRQLQEQKLVQEEQEYQRMAKGQVLKLPEEFAAMLSEAGIRYVYGMEWLKKNGYLETGHPFLPYSLILSAQELKRLANYPKPVYTSFPVPIILREQLTKEALHSTQAAEGINGTVHSFLDLNFFVWFNRNLLDEDKLKNILKEKEAVIRSGKKALEHKKQEYAGYIGMQEQFKRQKVTKQSFDNVKEGIRRHNVELADAAKELIRLREAFMQQEALLKESEGMGIKLEADIFKLNRRIKDFDGLCSSYEAYREDSRLLEKNRQQTERVQNQQRLKKERVFKLEQKLITARNNFLDLSRRLEESLARRTYFAQYKGAAPEGVSVFSRKEAQEAEVCYEAVTGGIGAEQAELERLLKEAEQRYTKAFEELNRCKGKYGLSEGACRGVHYDRNEEQHQETILWEQEQKIKKKDAEISDARIRHALLGQKRENKFAELKERCQKDEPVLAQDIRTIDFSDAMRTLAYQKKEAEKEEADIAKRIQSYEGNLAALAEYEEFECIQKVEWELDFGAVTGEQLAKQKGILVRDYHASLEARRGARADLERTINRMLRNEAFSEDFYQKPLEAMLQLTGDAPKALWQLDTTLASYQSLIEKLMVDISLVEKEKEKIVELIGDYLKEAHANLNKIDHNSTIMIKNRPVKMLRVELPGWEENENFYGLRLKDYMDGITAKGIALLEENKNLQEYLGTKVTTKGLFDAVVGIGNVQIKLYKIEAQREYPITWADVAKNSGGEGFLSAVVVLSALLYYMRRDETDLFADRNEGKVLLMDNPFAQTNAAHLLTPLINMADKMNTQLICLSGLGGEAIYNCFDNIYVLSLVAASLRNDMQYLKAGHVRGSGQEEILPAQIEVVR